MILRRSIHIGSPFVAIVLTISLRLLRRRFWAAGLIPFLVFSIRDRDRNAKGTLVVNVSKPFTYFCDSRVACVVALHVLLRFQNCILQSPPRVPQSTVACVRPVRVSCREEHGFAICFLVPGGKKEASISRLPAVQCCACQNPPHVMQ